jgi:hypothetical protein
MASAALRREISAACGCITKKDIQIQWRTWRRSALTLRRGQDTVNVLGDGPDVVRGHGHRRHGRHPGVVESVANDRKNRFPGLIVEDERRSQQIGSATLAAPKVRAMTRSAVRSIKRIASGRQGRIDHTLLGRKGRWRRVSAAPIRLGARHCGNRAPTIAASALLSCQHAGEAYQQQA